MRNFSVIFANMWWKYVQNASRQNPICRNFPEHIFVSTAAFPIASVAPHSTVVGLLHQAEWTRPKENSKIFLRNKYLNCLMLDNWNTMTQIEEDYFLWVVSNSIALHWNQRLLWTVSISLFMLTVLGTLCIAVSCSTPRTYCRLAACKKAAAETHLLTNPEPFTRLTIYRVASGITVHHHLRIIPLPMRHIDATTQYTL